MNRFETAIAARMISTYVEELRRMEEAATPATECAPSTSLDAVRTFSWKNAAKRRSRAVKVAFISECAHGLQLEVLPVGEEFSMILPMWLSEEGDHGKACSELIGQFLAAWIDGHHNSMDVDALARETDFVAHTFLRAFLERARERGLTEARIRRVAIQALHDIAMALIAYRKAIAPANETPEIAPAIPANANHIYSTRRLSGHADDLWLIGFMLMPLILIVPLILKIEGL